jgi:hypothetical protein
VALSLHSGSIIDAQCYGVLCGSFANPFANHSRQDLLRLLAS